MHLDEMKLEPRLLLGPGPSNLHPSVQSAMTAPIVGHLDTQFLEIMSQTTKGLRHVYGTGNRFTVPVSGTGSSGLDALIGNLLEPGDECVVGVIGYFGQRLADMARRMGAHVRTIEVPFGDVIPPERLDEELRRRRADVVAIVHAETSTGACQPLADIAKVAHEHGALVVADCVTSLGGMPIDFDEVEVDAAGSCTQKCLGAPPGLGPITLNERAWQKISARKTDVPSWYLDLSQLLQYWADGDHSRSFHHTAPILSVYALYEALRLCLDEGLESRFERHRRAQKALLAGLDAMGLSLFTPEGHRLPMLHVINVPAGVDDLTVRQHLLNLGIEIAGGLGPLSGKTWRVGLMGYNAEVSNVIRLLSALEQALSLAGHPVRSGAGPLAASKYLD